LRAGLRKKRVRFREDSVLKLDNLTKVGFILLLCGCGAALPDHNASTAGKDLETLARTISGYAGKMRRPPNDLAELKAWLKKASPKDLKLMGVDDVERIFASPRDHEPYVYTKPRDVETGRVFAHEKTGLNGKKLMIGADHVVIEATEEQLSGALNEDASQARQKG